MKDYKFKINGNLYKVSVNSVVDNIAEVEVNGTPYKVELDKPAKKQIRPLKRPQAAPTTPTGEPVVSRPSSPSAAGAVRTPLPGVILEVSVKVGDTVKRGQKVMILEAMKMENSITTDYAGTVKQILVAEGQTVATDAVLMEIE